MNEIFKKLIEYKLTPNAFYVLYCIKENIVPYNFINKELECRRLQKDNWLTESLQLTDKSIIFTVEIDGYFKKSKKKYAQKSKTKKKKSKKINKTSKRKTPRTIKPVI